MVIEKDLLVKAVTAVVEEKTGPGESARSAMKARSLRTPSPTATGNIRSLGFGPLVLPAR